jgi:hypothetical protein
MTRQKKTLDTASLTERLDALAEVAKPKRVPVKPDTRLRSELRNLFMLLDKQNVAMKYVCNPINLSQGSVRDFLDGHRDYSVKMLAKLSRSMHLQALTGLDEVTLFTVMTLWSLAEFYPPEKLEKHMRQALKVVLKH